MKKYLFLFLCLFLVFFGFKSNIYADSIDLVRIGGNYYESLVDAINAADENDVIYLLSDIKLDASLNINKPVTINLNNKTISADNLVFKIQNGTLNLIGNGVVKEEKPFYGAVLLKGSDNIDDTYYSNLSVASGVLLEGWSGIFIDQYNKKGYGVNVSFDGVINALNDINGDSGVGIYVNGSIKEKENYPVINISGKITSTGVGLYMAGYSKCNIESSSITAVASAVGIKSGILNISDSKLVATGLDKTPTTGSSSGINDSGAVIQIESNSNYKGDMVINIDSGEFISNNGNVIYEYIGKGSITRVSNIVLKGGKYVAKNDVFKLSDDFINKHGSFISGGAYSSNPSKYLESDYTTSFSNGLYNVIRKTVNDNSNIYYVFKETNTKGKNICFIIFIFICLLIFVFKNKVFDKLKNIIKKNNIY